MLQSQRDLKILHTDWASVLLRRRAAALIIGTRQCQEYAGELPLEHLVTLPRRMIESDHPPSRPQDDDSKQRVGELLDRVVLVGELFGWAESATDVVRTASRDSARQTPGSSTCCQCW